MTYDLKTNMNNRKTWCFEVNHELYINNKKNIDRYIEKILCYKIEDIENIFLCNSSKKLMSLTVPALKTTFIMEYSKRFRPRYINEV